MRCSRKYLLITIILVILVLKVVQAKKYTGQRHHDDDDDDDDHEDDDEDEDEEDDDEEDNGKHGKHDPGYNDTIPSTPKDSNWLDLVDQTDVPKLAVRKVGSGICKDAKCDGSDNEKCYETCGNKALTEDVYGCKEANQWALTFDDGPSEFTPELLDILKKYDTKATFCVTGARVEKYPEFLKRAFEEGHHIAMHTYSHPHLMSLSNEDIIYEIKSTQLAIENAIGVRPRYLRPPFGEADARVKALAKAMDLKILMWNVDPRDYDVAFNHQSGSRILKSMKQVIDSKQSLLNVKNDPGFISLQHDLYMESISQVPKIIRALKKQKFQLTTVAECIGDSEPHGDAELLTMDAQSISSGVATEVDNEDGSLIQKTSHTPEESDIHADNAAVPESEKSSSVAESQNDASDANSSDKSSSTPHSFTSSASFSYSHIFSSMVMVVILRSIASFFL